MSSWPLISHFASMLKNPQVGFRDPQYQDCTVEMNQLGQPKARSGNFATVYRGFRPDGSEFAIRVFNRRQDERLEHYRTISEYLEGRSISSLVRFAYDPRGIRSAGDGKLYPLLTMEWVPGITLFEWIRDRCREGYGEALQIGSEVWLHLVRELAEHRVVHGDLQHGNVMVSPEGHFKLVDYDCMCVPSLIGRRNMETGLPPYQHPGRDSETVLFGGLDNFSALVIYVALRALAASPELWQSHVDGPDYDRILFREEDFRAPASSPLYRDLLNSPDEQVRDLAHYLFELTRFDLRDVPAVDEVLLWCESIAGLAAAEDWDKVVEFVRRMGTEERIPAELEPVVDEAERRVACREAMEQALASGDEARVEELYQTGLLEGYPAAEPLLAAAGQAAEVRGVLRVLASARRLQAWDQFKRTWEANQQLLEGRVSAAPYRLELRKLALVERLGSLLAATSPDLANVFAVWDELRKLGGHPLAESLRAKIELLSARHQSLERLQACFRQRPRTPTLAHDKQLVASASAEVIDGLNPQSTLVRHYRAAARRLKSVQRVHELEKVGTVESETYIAKVMQVLPKTYHDGLAKRAAKARQRLLAFRRLERMIAHGEPEADLLRAWERLAELRGRVLASESMRTRIELAESRVRLLDALRSIPENDPVACQRRVLELWNPEVLDGCVEAEPWRDVFQRARAAQEALKRAQAAFEAGQLAAVKRWLAEPALQEPGLAPELAELQQTLRSQVHQALAATRQELVTALLENRRAAFTQAFDALVVREICEQFPHHQPVVRQWVEAELVPAERIGFAHDPETAVTRDEGEGLLQMQWQWPPSRVCDHCDLLVTHKAPQAQGLPEDVESLYQVKLERPEGDGRGEHQVVLANDWEGARVYLWAQIDLGFQVFSSEPYFLGEIPSAEAKNRGWGLFRAWRSARGESRGDSAKQSGAEHGKSDEPPATTSNQATPPV